MPSSSQQRDVIDPGNNNWLAALIDSFEDVARAGNGVSCDPCLVLAVRDHLARPVPADATADRQAAPQATLV